MHKGMWLLLAAVSVTCLSLAAFWFGSSYGDGTATSEAVSNADPAHAADGVGEGIKVHGDWELTVSDPDGSNAMVYNFENHLWGYDFLANLLLPHDQSTAEKIVAWYLVFRRPHPENVPADGYNVQDPNDLLCETLAVAEVPEMVPPYLAKDVALVVAGSCFVKADGTGQPFTGDQEIEHVRTRVVSKTHSCDPCTGIPGAHPDRPTIFTNKKLNEKITVSPGQLIAATVKITFGGS